MPNGNEREFIEQADTTRTGRTEPPLGPSDSSDSANDLPPDAPDTDSDRSSTGERAEVENTKNEPAADDVQPDKIVPEDQAGLAHTPPNPVDNGGWRE